MANDIEELLRSEHQVRQQLPYNVTVGGKSYKVRQVSQKVRTKIDNLAKDALFLERESKKEMTLRQAKRLNRKIRSIHSKMAAYYLLGNWALFVPFLFAIRWRLLELQNSEVTFTINNAGANDPDTGFYFANWEIIKGLLVLSTKSVGDGIKEYQERMESAENMVETDASPKREEDGKSGASLKGHRTTRK